jgi:outer membrane protein OmpA-like peptidoglycan-associated protein
MTKGQIYTLLDVPHFRTGLVGVRRWNYILNFYTGNGDEYVACQYQIRFDSRSRVEGTYWRDQSCADLVERLLASPSVAAPVAAPAATVVVSRSSVPTRTYDFTFAFDSSVVDAEGMRVLREAAQEINTGQYAEVIVTGYTDTVGSVDYNDALAARRAAQGAGVLRSLVSVPVYSRSSRDLEVPTTTQVEDVRNRRVQIELYATAVERPHPTTVR